MLQGQTKIIVRCNTNSGNHATGRQLRVRSVAQLGTLLCSFGAARQRVKSFRNLEACNLITVAVVIYVLCDCNRMFSV
jgi:hypothetical protein